MIQENSGRVSFPGRSWTAMAIVGLFLSTAAWAATEKVLLNFHGTDGAYAANLTFDSAGNIFGVATAGGTGPCSGGCGTIFELKKTSSGWVTSVVHDFQGGADGANPGVGLIFDAAGNLYGATSWGAAGGCSVGCGTIFKLSAGTGGNWTKKILYRFTVSAGSGYYPNGPLVMDASGNLYGTTFEGGACTRCGTVFELSPTASGPWSLTVLHSFTGSPDGSHPSAGLTFDAHGYLFGTTAGGHGTVFELSPAAGGGWTESIIYSFLGGADGSIPNGGLVFDSAGNLYGTTNQGGNSFGQGTVFELSPIAGGGWSKTTIYTFEAYPFGTDGSNPNYMTPIFDAAGNMYGTNYQGGPSNIGAVFELSPGSGGTWTYNMLLGFGTNPGEYPISSLILDSAGNLYGTTILGGTNGHGIVFELTP